MVLFGNEGREHPPGMLGWAQAFQARRGKACLRKLDKKPENRKKYATHPDATDRQRLKQGIQSRPGQEQIIIRAAIWRCWSRSKLKLTTLFVRRSAAKASPGQRPILTWFSGAALNLSLYEYAVKAPVFLSSAFVDMTFKLPRFLGRLSCKEQSQSRCFGKWTLLVAAVLLLGAPAGREWLVFVLSKGKSSMPKGWKWGPGQWRDWDKPTEPRDLAAYEYAHSLKLPESLPKPAPFKPAPFNFMRHLLSNRRQTGLAYFKHLCETEAGEYVFRKVEKVQGIYQMRRVPKWNARMFADRYGFEDPADWSTAQNMYAPSIFIGGPTTGFRFYETNWSPLEMMGEVFSKYWKIKESNDLLKNRIGFMSQITRKQVMK